MSATEVAAASGLIIGILVLFVIVLAAELHRAHKLLAAERYSNDMQIARLKITIRLLGGYDERD